MASNGAVIYTGPSRIDGSPIVCIVTGTKRPSSNPKTGPMLQVWILRADVPPIDAARDGADVGICGGCKHRPTNTGTCYVSLFQGPRAVYAAFATGGYDVVPELADIAELGAGRKVRLGAYGDPTAVPFAVLSALISRAECHTGYTHQWASERIAADYRQVLQASVDTPEEFERARRKGWATFRVRAEGADLMPGEFQCPAADGSGKVTCADCGACDGSDRLVSIEVHGARKSRFQA